jgi:hypothetical protein
MRKLILTDIDETVLQFCAPFQAFAQRRGVATAGNLREIYDIAEFLQRDREGAEAFLQEFVAEEGHRQPAEPCAKTVLPELAEQGYEFVGITACGHDPAFKLDRINNLRWEFGFPFSGLLTVDLQGSKRELLSWFAPAIWVEDHFEHAVTGAELGHRVFLMDKPYNAGLVHPGVTRVTGWNMIATILAADA